MPQRGCPIKFSQKCKNCPLPPAERINACKFYAGQMRRQI